MINSRTLRMIRRLRGSLLIFTVVLSMSGCGSEYEPLVGTYRGVLVRPGEANVTFVLYLGYNGWGWGHSWAQLWAFSPDRPLVADKGDWKPKADNRIET